MQAARLVKQNIESEKRIDEEIKEIEVRADSNIREKFGEKVKQLFRKKEKEEPEEQSIEEKTNQQARELYELVEGFTGGKKRHIHTDRMEALLEIKSYLEYDLDVPDLKLP